MASRSPTAVALAVVALVLGGCHGLRGARWQNRDDGSTGSQLLKGAEHHWGGMTGEMPGGGEIQPPGLRPKGRVRRLSKKCTSPPCAGGVGWGQGGKDPSPKACTEPPCNGGTPPTPKASCGTPPCGEGVAWGRGGNPEGSGESGEESKEIVDEEIDAILSLADADVRDVGVAVNPLEAFDESEESPSESDSDESPSEASSEESESESEESESESSSEESESSAESSEESLPSEGSAEGDELVVGIDEEPTPTEDPFDVVLRTREHATDDGDSEGTLR